MLANGAAVALNLNNAAVPLPLEKVERAAARARALVGLYGRSVQEVCALHQDATGILPPSIFKNPFEAAAASPTALGERPPAEPLARQLPRVLEVRLRALLQVRQALLLLLAARLALLPQRVVRGRVLLRDGAPLVAPRRLVGGEVLERGDGGGLF